MVTYHTADDHRTVNYIELLRHLDEPLGLVVKGKCIYGNIPIHINVLVRVITR